MNDEESNNNKKIIQYYPKFDNSFKNLFKVEENKNLLIDLLNDVLDCKNNDPIVSIQYIDTEITPHRAKNAIVIDKLDNLSLNEKEIIYNQLNAKNEYNIDEYNTDEYITDEYITDEYITDENVDTKKKEKKTFGENANKIVKTDNFFGKTIRLDSLISSIRESYKNEISNNEFAFLKLNKNHPLFAMTKAKELINIEIQLHQTENMCKRSLLYASYIITRSLPSNENNDFNVDDIPHTVLIIFLNYNIFKNKNKFHWCFSILDKETKAEEDFEGLLNIHFIELAKFERLKKEEQYNEKYRWFLFMVDPNNNVFLNKNTQSKFTQARNTLLSLEGKKDYVKACKMEQDAFQSYLSGLEYREKKGRKEGRKEGKEEGLKNGKKIRSIITAMKFLKRGDTKSVKDFIKLNESEIKEINDFMNQSDYTIEQLAEKLNVDPNELKIYLMK